MKKHPASASPDSAPQARKIPRRNKRLSNKGIALITVLSLLAITTILVAAFFSLAKVELISSKTYSDGIRSRQLAETAVNIAISQIKKATLPPPSGGNSKFYSWTSQPGAIRKYDDDGEFFEAYKLYSDENMVISTSEGEEEKDLVEDAPPEDWNSRDNTIHYVDMNSPMVRTIGSGEIDEVLFPIVDPRAAWSGGGRNAVEGFSYSETFSNGNSIRGVKTPGSSGSPEELRLPMPVQWLYVLEDGTLGTLDSSDQFRGQSPTGSSVAANEDNPIVARIAFWTDDESSKINVNTASEPTHWAVPVVTSTRDKSYAFQQPVRGEFQRYPGHPATTALSPVLFPGITNITPADKERIYGLIPRINGGGSQSGTVDILQFTTENGNINPDSDRLYATLDEFLFSPVWDETRGREPNADPLSPGQDLDAASLERARFFLTANSRAPETNIFNLPRISMWPLNAQEDDQHRSSFDNIISFCSTLNGIDYSFLRQDEDSPTYDILQIEENRDLFFRYLHSLTNEKIPGYGRSFRDKYGSEEKHQILTEIFDYIRCTNLHDDLLAPEDSFRQRQNSGGVITGQYTDLNPPPRSLWGTYTDPRKQTNENAFEEDEIQVFPGHGQVTPIRIPNPESRSDAGRGFGRYFTISEVAIQFICLGEGTSFDSNERWGPVQWGGQTYYNNIPPNADQLGLDPPKVDDLNEPVFTDEDGNTLDPQWVNHALDPGKRLEPGQKRVQAILQVEMFSPSLGWTQINPDFHITIKGLEDLQVNGEDLFPVDEYYLKPSGSFADGGNRGGPAGVRGFLINKDVPGRGGLRDDPRISDDRRPDLQYRMVSNIIQINASDADKLQFTGGSDLTFEIYHGRNQLSFGPGQGAKLIQKIEVAFPSGDKFPAPDLVRVGSPVVYNERGVLVARETVPPHWWCFNRSGSIGEENAYPGRFVSANQRIAEGGSARNWTRRPLAGRFIMEEDCVQSVLPWHGDYRLVLADDWVKLEDGLFQKHRLFGKAKMAHNLYLGRDTRNAPEFDGGDDYQRLVRGADFHPARYPDWPMTVRLNDAVRLIQTYQDYDNGVATVPAGAYINKPDEGDTRVRDEAAGDVPYFSDPWRNEAAGASYFSPNRMVPSPIMFGSLSTGVKSRDPSVTRLNGTPWKTLLFRPPDFPPHKGAANYPSKGDPADHLFADLFWMPVVEPYPISEPLSTAGKINLNYQILPFTHITRATGLHGLLKGEWMLTLPQSEADQMKTLSGGNFRSKDGEWWQKINVEETLKQFETRFDKGEVFKTASELCDVHLIPGGEDGKTKVATASEVRGFWQLRGTSGPFWKNDAMTGDNSRERPYAHVYPRTTTKSNVFTVHVRAQAIQKSSLTDPNKFVSGRDSVVSEYRGSTMIERYIDPNQPDIPDYRRYAEVGIQSRPGDPGMPPLDDFYRYRIVSTKRFSP